MSEPLLLSRRLESPPPTGRDGDSAGGPQGQGPDPRQTALAGCDGTEPLLVLALSADERQRLRGHCRSTCGRDLLLQLPREGGPLQPREWLAGDDGIPRVRVEAAPEDLLRVRSDDALTLLRAAYHLGNRHVALELREGELRLLQDPVLADLLRGLGVGLESLTAPFEPESGAYASGHAHRPVAGAELEPHAAPRRHGSAGSAREGDAAGHHHPHRP